MFRADATPQLGGGHVYRCLALAHALVADGWACGFSCNEGAERVVSWLDRSPFRRVRPGDLGHEPADLLVVDHYDLGARYERDCRAWAGEIMAIDDLADRRHDVDLLLDQNIGRQAADYAPLVSSNSRVITGPSFALLREAFGRRRLAGLKPRMELRRVLVAMGATDPDNATSTVLSGLAELSNLHIDVVLGSGAMHLAAVRDQARRFGDRCRVSAEIDDEAMAVLIEQADLAIAAPGGSAWERCSLGLPSLLVVLADNQRPAADHLVRAGAARLLGSHPGLVAADVTAGVRLLTDDATALSDMSHAAALVCDGLGARRVAAIVAPERCADGAAVSLRPVTASDRDVIFEWQAAPEMRRYFRQSVSPTASEHAAWFAAALVDTDRLLNIIEVDGQAAGVLRLDRVHAGKGAADHGFEVSILVDFRVAGRGVAKAALRSARRLMAGQRLEAYVAQANVASRRAFEASGYRLHDGRYVNPAS